VNGVDIVAVVKSAVSSSHGHSSPRSAPCSHGTDTRTGILQPIALSRFLARILPFFSTRV